jgi:hypothetical protein
VREAIRISDAILGACIIDSSIDFLYLFIIGGRSIDEKNLE